MNWINKCPGIDQADFKGFKLTRLEEKKVPGRIRCRGDREQIPVYKYVAIRPGEPVQRFTGYDLEQIKAEILSLTVQTLF